MNFESRAPTFEKTGGMIDLRPVRLRCVQSSCFLFALDSPVTCTKQLLISSSGGEHSFISVRSLNFSPKAEGDYMSWMLIIYIAEANLDGWNIPGTDIVVLPVDLTHQEKMDDMRQTSKLHRKAPVGHHHWRANDYMGSDG